MEYFIGLLFVWVVIFGANIYEKNISKLRFYLGILIMVIGVLLFGQYQYNVSSKLHGTINHNLIESYEKEIDSIVNYYENRGYITTIGHVRNINTTIKSPYFTVTKDTVIYTGKNDTTINIGKFYKYYRVRIEGNPNNLRHIRINATHDIHAEYGDTILNSELCKYRRIKNGEEQYSFDGVNWFGL